MAWLKIDDDWMQHPKVRRATPEAQLLWFNAAVGSAKLRTDGIVEAHLVADYAYYAKAKVARAAASLVAAGLWHDAETIRECVSCRDMASRMKSGDFYFHDWRVYQPSKADNADSTSRFRKNRARRLATARDLKAGIVLRDRSLCRYCGRLVDETQKDRSQPDAASFDHLDPFGENTLDNLVLACQPCNSRKNNRTPEQAGVRLLPVPGAPDIVADELVLVGTGPGPSTDRQGGPSTPRPAIPGPGRAMGRDTGRAGPGEGQVGPVRDRPEPVSGAPPPVGGPPAVALPTDEVRGPPLISGRARSKPNKQTRKKRRNHR